MTYHQTLIVKDTRDVHKCWKWSIIITLLCVVGTGLAVTFSFHALLDNFNTNCISGAKLAFKTSSDDDPEPSQSAASAAIAPQTHTNGSSAEHAAPAAYGDAAGSPSVDEIAASSSLAAGATNTRRWQRGARHNYSERFREHFEPITVGTATTLTTRLGGGGNTLRRKTLLASGLVMVSGEDVRLEATLRQQLANNEEDIEFFDSQIIDELNTFWGPMAPCEYISFVPLIEAIVAIVWVTMFMMCGNGGRSNETFVDEPWRIVLPAFCFFALMTVVSAVHLVVLLSRLAHFCAELKQHFHDQTVPCTLLINQFSMNDDFAVPPSHNYVLAITFSWLRLVFWALSVAVMTARCFKGTDFELVESGGSASCAGESGTERPSRALLNGYASETSQDETVVERVPHRTLLKRVQLTSCAVNGNVNDDTDSNVETDDADTLIAPDDHGSVHLNGVEFRPSAQLLRTSAPALRPTCPAAAIAEESTDQSTTTSSSSTATTALPASGTTTRLQVVGSNCRRLVNEIGQLREPNKPKRIRKYLDSRS